MRPAIRPGGQRGRIASRRNGSTLVQAQRPVPVEDDDTRPYWEAAREHRLELQRCQDCGKLLFPPRPRCPGCLSTALVWTELSGRGRVYSFTIIYVPVVRGLEPPYVVAQVELDEQPGLRLVANIVDREPGAVVVGMPVQVAFEDFDEDHTLPQFAPMVDSECSLGNRHRSSRAVP